MKKRPPHRAPGRPFPPTVCLLEGSGQGSPYPGPAQDQAGGSIPGPTCCCHTWGHSPPPRAQECQTAHSHGGGAEGRGRPTHAPCSSPGASPPPPSWPPSWPLSAHCIALPNPPGSAELAAEHTDKEAGRGPVGLGGFSLFAFFANGVFTAPQPRPGRPRVSWGRPAGGSGTGSAGWEGGRVRRPHHQRP